MSTPTEQADAVEREARMARIWARNMERNKPEVANAWDARAKALTEAAATLRRVQQMEAEIARLREALSTIQESFDDLMSNSEGVYGLHLNGDPAPWESLMEDGEFGEWLGDCMNKASAALAHDGEAGR